MTSQSKTISYDTRVHIFWALVTSCFLLLSIYIYALYATIGNTVARQELESHVASLNSEQSRLEFEYITKKSSLDIDLAYQYGLKDARTPLYVSRATNSTLTLNTR